MNLDILLSDVARVARCVCCSASWTTRKTASQKLGHIQRCAKKNGYDDETVRILIKKEASSKESKGPPLAPSTSSTTTTLLEDVIQTRLKRKNVRPNNHLAQDLAVGSRDAILSRAKDIIAVPSPDETSSPSRKFVADFPLTQAFTASTLRQGSAKTSLFSATIQDDGYLSEIHDEVLDDVRSSSLMDQPTSSG